LFAHHVLLLALVRFSADGREFKPTAQGWLTNLVLLRIRFRPEYRSALLRRCKVSVGLAQIVAGRVEREGGLDGKRYHVQEPQAELYCILNDASRRPLRHLTNVAFGSIAPVRPATAERRSWRWKQPLGDEMGRRCPKVPHRYARLNWSPQIGMRNPDLRGAQNSLAGEVLREGNRELVLSGDFM